MSDDDNKDLDLGDEESTTPEDLDDEALGEELEIDEDELDDLDEDE